MIDIGTTLKEHRTACGYTQSYLAKATDIKQQNISRWESNTHNPDILDCIKLANFYGISLEELLGIEENFGARTPTLAAPMGDGLTAEERDILRMYRALPKKLQQMVRDNLEVYSETNEILPKNEKKV